MSKNPYYIKGTKIRIAEPPIHKKINGGLLKYFQHLQNVENRLEQNCQGVVTPGTTYVFPPKQMQKIEEKKA